MELNVKLFSDFRKTIHIYSSTFDLNSVILADICMEELSSFEFA
jgi:hypothetical protein